MKYIKPSILFLSVASLFASCEKEPDRPSNSTPASLKGVFCTNEGAFLGSNAGVTFWPTGGGNTVTDLYASSNGFPLGDVLQSMSIFGNRAYLCVNNSQKVEVVSMTDFKRIGTISGISGPRYFTGINDSLGAISDWVSNQVYLVNLNTLSKVDSVVCGKGPEQMVVKNNMLFVCNSGGFDRDSSITVISLPQFSVQATIATAVNPAFIRANNSGELMVVCRGSLGDDYTPSPDDPGGAILRINPTTLAIGDSVQFNWDQHPLHLELSTDGTSLYFLLGIGFYTGKIMRVPVSNLTQTPAQLSAREFYALGLEPTTQQLYAGKAVFSSNTHVLRFDAQGTLLDSLPCGIAPNGFVFNP